MVCKDGYILNRKIRFVDNTTFFMSPYPFGAYACSARQPSLAYTCRHYSPMGLTSFQFHLTYIEQKICLVKVGVLKLQFCKTQVSKTTRPKPAAV